MPRRTRPILEKRQKRRLMADPPSCAGSESGIAVKGEWNSHQSQLAPKEVRPGGGGSDQGLSLAGGGVRSRLLRRQRVQIQSSGLHVRFQAGMCLVAERPEE